MDTLHYCILMLAVVRYSNGVENPPVGKCVSFKQFRMTTADCKWQNFVEVPQHLNKNIEILVASGNRIRQLTTDTFKYYTSLRYLYLDNNFIITIEEGTFNPLTELEVLDLSTNAIKNIPAELPYPLRKLYLSENPLEEISLSSAYNLQFLALSDCNLKELPDMGVLPLLEELNVTGNPLSTLTPVKLSSMCRLKKLHLPKSLYKPVNSECDCYKLLTWTTHHHINVGNYTCSSLENPEEVQCYTNNTEETKSFESCLQATPKTAVIKYIIGAVILISVIVFVFVIMCCCRRKKKRKAKSKSRNTCNTTTQNQEKKMTLIL